MMRLHLVYILILFCICSATGQTGLVTLSGNVRSADDGEAIPFVTIQLKRNSDTVSFVSGFTDDNGRFVLEGIPPGHYQLITSLIGFKNLDMFVLVGRLTSHLDLGLLDIQPDILKLDEITVSGKRDLSVSSGLEKKSFSLESNSSQLGGSVLSAMRNLPGITVGQDGSIQLRGSDKVAVLIDGRQTAVTGFGNQAGLDNIPASAVERIEIINNPSARHDAQGNAGIINIIYKKVEQKGFNGKIGLVAGIGSLWEKSKNLPDIRSQYVRTPKLNPSLSLNYRNKKTNYFFQGDVIHQRILNKNEFSDRFYRDGSVVRQQYQENRDQTSFMLKTGVDFFLNEKSDFTLSALYGREAHVDHGDLPYFNRQLTERHRLWVFREWEANTTLSAQASYVRRFASPGHKLTAYASYTFQREDEKYWMTDYQVNFVNKDTFMLIADQHVADISLDYVRPLRQGRLEMGAKYRWRKIPTNMRFFPGDSSEMDVNAGGWANYREAIPALYGSYVYESKQFELEAGVRMEYVGVDYEVIPSHNTYNSDGYRYFQPFPTIRIAYVVSPASRFSLFYNRRVDRPEEQDLRIFPKYDDPEILKTGNPALRPQFTNSLELGYRSAWSSGSIYGAVYRREMRDILTRILTIPKGGEIINSISQNAGKGTHTGIELLFEKSFNAWFRLDLNLNFYRSVMAAFSVRNLYPFPIDFSMDRQTAYSGNAKLNARFSLSNGYDLQFTGVYLARDRIPQGVSGARGGMDFGLKKSVQEGRGEVFLNGSDLFNTMRIKKEVLGNGFTVTSRDNYESQIFRVGYSYNF